MSVWVRFFWKMSFGTKLTATTKKVLCCAELFFISELKIRVCEPLPNSFGGCSITQSRLNLWLQELQHARLLCPSPSPGACSNSCPLRWWCHPTMSSFFHFLLPLTSIFPSIKVFSNDSALCIRWPNYWSFSFSISCSSKYSGMMSFRIDWFDLLAVQGTLKSLLQNHSSKASVFFALSLLYGPALTPILD